MASRVENRVLDLGLNVLKTEATHIYLCSSEPATFTAATSTAAVGSKNHGAGNVTGSPVAGARANSRKVSTTAVADGAVTATGNATNWALVDATNSRLLAVGALAAAQAVTSGNTFTLPSFDIELAGQA